MGVPPFKETPISTRHRFRPCPTSQGTEKDEANCKSPKAFQRTSPPMEAKPKSCPNRKLKQKHTHPIRIQVCLYVLRFFGVISGLYIYNPMTWGFGIWTINPTNFREGFWILPKGQRVICNDLPWYKVKKQLQQIQVFGFATYGYYN